jgi:hypothetical protein
MIAISIGVAIAVVRVSKSAGASSMAILCGTWFVSFLWAPKRPSFSVLFTAITIEVLLFATFPSTGLHVSGNASIAGYDYRAGFGRAYEGARLELLTGRLARSENIQEPVFTSVCGAIIRALFAREPIAPVLTTFLSLLVATALICRQRSPVLATVRVPVPSKHFKPRRAPWPVGTE